MKAFEKTNSVTTLVFKDKKAKIVKVVKVGTKRTFFAVTNENDQYLTRILFARKYDAESVAKQYLRN